MNDRTLLSARVAECNAKYPTSYVAPPQAEPFVGENPERMSDEEREQAAYRAGNAMLGWYSAYRQSGNPAFLDNAYQALGLQKKLLAGRSPEFVAKLERERGLA